MAKNDDKLPCSFENIYGGYIEGVFNRDLMYCTSITSLRDYIDKGTAMFYYDNLPENLTSRTIELALLYRPNICFWYSKALDRVILCQYIFDNIFDEYMQPLSVNLLAFNGVHLANNVPWHDIVPIRDNVMGIPYIFPLIERVRKVETAEKTFDIVMLMLRFGVAFECESKESAQQLKAICKKVMDFEPAIFASKSKVLDKIHNMDIHPTCDVNELFLTIQNMLKLTYNSIGIYGDVSKKERLLKDEVANQNEFVDITYHERLQARQHAIDEVNKKWGTNIVLRELKDDIKERNIEYEVEQEVRSDVHESSEQ